MLDLSEKIKESLQEWAIDHVHLSVWVEPPPLVLLAPSGAPVFILVYYLHTYIHTQPLFSDFSDLELCCLYTLYIH